MYCSSNQILFCLLYFDEQSLIRLYPNITQYLYIAHIMLTNTINISAWQRKLLKDWSTDYSLPIIAHTLLALAQVFLLFYMDFIQFSCYIWLACYCNNTNISPGVTLGHMWKHKPQSKGHQTQQPIYSMGTQCNHAVSIYRIHTYTHNATYSIHNTCGADVSTSANTWAGVY